MRKVIGIGETVFDIIFHDDQPVNATPGGSTYNSMISLGRAGISAEFISETGDDRVGRRIMAFLEENGVSSQSVCIHSGQKSALSLAFLNAQKDAEYVFYKDHARDRLEFRYPQIEPDDVVLFGSFYAINPVVRDQVKSFLKYASECGAILYYDVNFRSSHKDDALKLLPNIRENFELADVVRGSNEDFEILFDMKNADDVYEQRIAPFCRNFIYTRGAEPAEMRSADGMHRQYPAEPVNAVSTIGAGDNFNAGFAYGLIRYGITRQQLRCGLSADQWNGLFECAQAFSGNVCQSMYNYIDVEFGIGMKEKMNIIKCK
ncbi:MAG: carbohydrate kinase [Proteobacteria bacterium]|nr:carbohydrate kinase [Pseudomonadota bacterium]